MLSFMTSFMMTTKWATDQSATRTWPCMNIVIFTHNLDNSPIRTIAIYATMISSEAEPLKQQDVKTHDRKSEKNDRAENVGLEVHVTPSTTWIYSIFQLCHFLSFPLPKFPALSFPYSACPACFEPSHLFFCYLQSRSSSAAFSIILISTVPIFSVPHFQSTQ